MIKNKLTKDSKTGVVSQNGRPVLKIHFSCGILLPRSYSVGASWSENGKSGFYTIGGSQILKIQTTTDLADWKSKDELEKIINSIIKKVQTQ